MTCKACSREVENGAYCKYHAWAFEKLKGRYSVWVKAYGAISWEEYLFRLENTKETGLWAKEVIATELKK